MSHRFRASQGHLSCVLAVAIVVVLLIPATAAAQAQRGCDQRLLRARKSHTLSESRGVRGHFIAHRKPSDTRIGGPSSSVTLIWGPAKRRQSRPT